MGHGLGKNSARWASLQTGTWDGFGRSGDTGTAASVLPSPSLYFSPHDRPIN